MANQSPTREALSTEPQTLLVRVYASVVKDYAERGVFPMLVPTGPLVQEGAVNCHVTRDLALRLLEDARAQHVRPITIRGRKKSYSALIEALDRTLDPAKWAKLDAEKEAARDAARAARAADWEAERARTKAEASPTTPQAAAQASADLAGLFAALNGQPVEDNVAPSNRPDGLWNAPGLAIARSRMEDSPARFRVGQTVRYWSPWLKDKQDGAKMEIVKGFGLHKVSEDGGPYVEDSGDRVSYRWGYVAQARGGRPTFYPPYMIQSVDYERHIRLVAPTSMATRQTSVA